jgi:RHS repeat-associated protein
VFNSIVTGGTDGLYTEGYTFETGTGNLKTKNGATYNYDTTHQHAVASVGSNTYGYDANGNMTSRYMNGQSFTLNYDAENRLVSVSGASTANFVYDADGKQVKTVVNGVTTYYVGNHYELKGTTVTKYYFAGATRLAVRAGTTLSYLLSDHIGSSSVTTDANGVKTASALYKAFGETRFSAGNLGTDYKFTGQREEASLGIYFFNARWMDPSLGRFTSPDSIVPTSTQGTQAWDRYAFVNNNPVRYNDPTGHWATGDEPTSYDFSTTCHDTATYKCPPPLLSQPLELGR